MYAHRNECHPWTCTISGARPNTYAEIHAHKAKCQQMEGREAIKLRNRNSSTSAAGGPSQAGLMDLPGRALLPAPPSTPTIIPPGSASHIPIDPTMMAPSQKATHQPGHKLPSRDAAAPPKQSGLKTHHRDLQQSTSRTQTSHRWLLRACSLHLHLHPRLRKKPCTNVAIIPLPEVMPHPPSQSSLRTPHQTGSRSLHLRQGQPFTLGIMDITFGQDARSAMK